jgi:hypothetical protein
VRALDKNSRLAQDPASRTQADQLLAAEVAVVAVGVAGVGVAPGGMVSVGLRGSFSSRMAVW